MIGTTYPRKMALEMLTASGVKDIRFWDCKCDAKCTRYFAIGCNTKAVLIFDAHRPEGEQEPEIYAFTDEEELVEFVLSEMGMRTCRSFNSLEESLVQVSVLRHIAEETWQLLLAQRVSA